MNYEEECWACGCIDCICATKSPDYIKRIIDAAVLAEREACAKVCEDMDHNGVMIAADCAAAIRARGNT